MCHSWDLSVGATAGTSSIFAAAAMSHGSPVILAILLGVGLGTLVGLVNALIITRGRVNAVIATLGMATILEGVVDQKSHGIAIVANIPGSVIRFGSSDWLGIPRTAYALALLSLTVYYVLGHTPVGRQLYALGENYEGARLVGLRTKLLRQPATGPGSSTFGSWPGMTVAPEFLSWRRRSAERPCAA